MLDDAAIIYGALQGSDVRMATGWMFFEASVRTIQACLKGLAVRRKVAAAPRFDIQIARHN